MKLRKQTREACEKCTSEQSEVQNDAEHFKHQQCKSLMSYVILIFMVSDSLSLNLIFQYVRYSTNMKSGVKQIL
jgi:hypothetical protein